MSTFVDVAFPGEFTIKQEHWNRNNSNPAFCLRGKTTATLKLFAKRTISVGDWWVMTGVLAHLPTGTASHCKYARQIFDMVWIFPDEACPNEASSVSVNYRSGNVLCMLNILFHARYVDYKDRELAHLKLDQSGVVVCVKPITSKTTEVILYSDFADNYHKENRQCVHRLKMFTSFLASQALIQHRAIDASVYSPFSAKLKAAVIVTTTVDNQCSRTDNEFLSMQDIVQQASANKAFDSSFPSDVEPGDQRRVSLLPFLVLYTELCVRFLFPNKVNEMYFRGRGLADLSARNTIISTNNKDGIVLTLVDYYVMFASVHEYYLRDVHSGLNMCDKLAERVNQFMMENSICVLSIDVLTRFMSFENFGNDLQYIISDAAVRDMTNKVCSFI